MTLGFVPGLNGGSGNGGHSSEDFSVKQLPSK
jgi:hypothetical protein